MEPRIPDEVFRPTAHNSTPAMAEAITDGFSPSLAGCTHQACGFLAASSKCQAILHGEDQVISWRYVTRFAKNADELPAQIS